ncbi:MAG TPA: hypothetical protein DEB12_02510 [Porphyromonadaceae bacterium]|jgi:hypothetical protein|nr:hypothetical protein [Porphyromonadaceae bacterium]
MLNKLKRIISLFKHRNLFINAETYYKDEVHKSRFTILCDQIYFICKYGNYEPYYFPFGFDRKSMSLDKICKEYIVPYHVFQEKIDRLNTINPKYGKHNGRVFTADKFYFNIFLEKLNIPTPKILLYIKEGEILFADEKYLKVYDYNNIEDELKHFFTNDMDVFVKPSDGQFGNGIFSLRIENNKIYVNNKLTDIIYLINLITKGDHLIQKRVVQHPLMAAFCSTTLNSVRLQTVVSKSGEIIPFGAGLRIGREGSSVDNWAKGGVFVGIDMENGKLRKKGFLKPMFGTSCTEHPDTHIPFENFEVPHFKEAVKLAMKLHKIMYRCHSVGWDIAITKDGPVFIEGNGLWQSSLIQAANGGMKHIEQYFN